MALTEHDIFKLCVKEPLFTAEMQNSLHKTRRPGPDATQAMELKPSGGDDASVENRDVQRYCLKLILKVWNGFGKFLHHQIHNNRCVNTIHLGKFMPAPKSSGICFIPNTQFLDASRLFYKEDTEFNLNPFSEIVRLFTLETACRPSQPHVSRPGLQCSQGNC